MSKDRLLALDSLRALAAIAVIYAHTPMFFGEHLLPMPFILQGISNQTSAVMFFFVLSGFVLHRSLTDQQPNHTTYTIFLIKRFFRIYPLFYFSLLLNYLILVNIPSEHIQHTPNGSSLYTVLHNSHTNLVDWFHQLTLIDHAFDFNFINPPSWTLTVEMRISIIFPLISFIFSKLQSTRRLLLLLLLFPASYYLGKLTFNTFQMLPLFAIGAFLAQVTMNKKIPLNNFSLSIITGASLLLYGLPAYKKIVELPPLLLFYLSGLGSAGIIFLILSTSATRPFLENKILTALGRWSYGLYILHFGVFLFVTHILKNIISQNSTFQAGLAVILLISLSAFSYSCIEKKFIVLGKKITTTYLFWMSKNLTLRPPDKP